MKKLLKVFLVIFAISALLAVFAACEPDCKGNHEYGEWHETTATCTAGGRVGYYQCSVCGLYFDANHQEIAEEDLDVPALGHTFNKDNSSDLIAEVPATCTDEGVAAHFHCNRCNKNFGTDGTTELTSIAIPALGHTFGAWVEEVPATCTEVGTKGHKTCSVCEKNFDADGNEIDDLTIPKANHAFGAWVEEVPATCFAEGTKGYKTCSVCEQKFDAQGNVLDSLVIPALGHNYVENVCSRCQDELTEQEVLDALFALESGEELPGTFKLTGTIVSIVTPWSEQYKNITVDILVGDKTVQCFRLKSTDEHDASTIAVGQQITVVGGLTNYNGTREFKTGCELRNVVVPSFSLGVTIEHGTTTALENSYPAGTRVSFKVTPDSGYKVDTVTVNGDLVLADGEGNYSFVIASNTTVVVTLVDESVVLDTVRIFNISEIAAANNYENGVAYTTLNITDTNLTIEALGAGNNGKFYASNQSWRFYKDGGELKISVASGFELVSVKVTFAQGAIGSLVSGESYTVAATEKSSVSFAATETTHVTEIMVVYRATCQHVWNEGEVTTQPTCTEAGVATFTCTLCGETKTENVSAALGHTYKAEDWIAEVPAICTENGTKGHFHCTRCNKDFDSENNEIANLTLTAPGHSFGAWVAEVPATCTTDGTKGHKDCSVCGKHFDAEGNVIADLTIAALGHTYKAEDWVAEVPATCTENGTKGHFHCTRCEKDFDEDGKEIANLTLAALGHNYEGQPYLPDTDSHYQECKNDSSESHRKYESCTIGETWCSDNEQHWHECSVCGRRVDEAEHDYDAETGDCECGNNIRPVVTVYNEVETKFATIVDAFEFAMNNYSAETSVVITLKNDLSGAGVKVVAEHPVNVVLDLGGHTYTVDGDAVGSTGYESQGFHFEKGSVITIKDGKLTSVAGSGVKMLLQNYCALTLDNVVADGTHLDGVAPYTSSNNFGRLTLKNGSEIIAAEGGVAFDCWYGMSSTYDDGVAIVVENGCTIDGVIEYGAASRVTGTEWTAKASIRLPAGDYTISLSSNQQGLDCTTANVTIDGVRIDHNFVSHVCSVCGTVETAVVVTAEGEEPKNFTTLAEAVAAVPADGKLHTLTLQYSIAGNGVKVINGQNILIDLNGNTYTVNANTVGSTGTETNGFQLLKGSVVTFKNGTINTVDAAGAKILIQNYCTLTLDNAILDGTNLIGDYTSSNNFGSLTLKNGSQIIAAEGGVAFDCWYGMSSTYDDGVAIVVEDGCTINGVIEYGAASRVVGAEWTAKASISLPAGDYTIRLSSNQTGLNCATANVTIDGVRIDHKYGEWTVTTAATCEQEGEQERTCSVCGNKEIAAIEKPDHTWGNLQQVEGVHDGKVVHSYTCTECGKIEYEECASDTWESDDGNHWKVCAVCGKTFAKAEHIYVDGKCECGKEEPVASSELVLTFPDDNNANNKAGSYTTTWTAKIGEQEWTIANFNNNNWNNEWTYIRCGRKSNASIATIRTHIAKEVTKVVLTVDSVKATDKINSIKLKVCSDDKYTNVVEEVVIRDIKAGELVFVINKSAPNLYYSIEVDCKAGSNGLIQISKVQYC